MRHETFSEGDRIKVIDGPFDGYDGILANVDRGQKRVTAMINAFGQQIPVEFTVVQVEKIEPE